MEFQTPALSGVRWGQTTFLASARGLIAGCIWIVVLPLSFDVALSMQLVGYIFLFMVFMPVAYGTIRLMEIMVGFIPLLKLVIAIISRGLSLAICVADPVVYIVNRVAPSVFGVPHFGVVNFYMVILVKDPEVM